MLTDAKPAQGTGSSGGGESTGSSQNQAPPQEAPRPDSGTVDGQRGSGQAQQGATGGTSEATDAGRPPQGAQGAGSETGSRGDGQPQVDIASLDAKHLLESHPTLRRLLDSRAGDLAQRQAEQRLQELMESNNLQQELERRRHLRATDPEAFARYDEEQEQRWLQQQDTQKLVLGQSLKTFDRTIAELQWSLPEEVQEEVAGKNFRDPSGDPVKSRALYLNALVQAAVKHGVTRELGPALAKARGEIEDTLKLQANGAQNGSEPRASVDGGLTPSGEYVTQEEFDQNGRGQTPAARAWRAANKERLDRSYDKTITR